MRARGGLWLVAALVAVTGCRKKAPPGTDGDASSSVAQPRFGDPDDQRKLSFAIDAVHRGEKPTTAPPWHAAGGDWTFFDAHTSRGTRFGFGWTTRGDAGSFTFGKAMLTVPSADEGAKLAMELARAFRATKVSAEGERRPLQIDVISFVVLASGVAHEPDGFKGQGTWTATKLFLQRPGIDAEVFFDFDLAGKTGFFAEKDADYANDLAAFVARELRDGPEPERTPESDPTRVQATGPKIGAFRELAKDAELLRFEKTTRRVLYTKKDGKEHVLVSASLADPKDSVEVARSAGHIAALVCTADERMCVLDEQTTKGEGRLSSEDPHTFTLLDRTKKTKRRLAGPWEPKGYVSENAFSPDGAFVAMSAWKPDADGRGNHETLHFVAVGTDAVTARLEDGEKSFEVAGWTGTGAGLRAIVKSTGAFELGKRPKPEVAEADPKTGARKAIGVVSEAVAAKGLSPDRKRQVACVEHQAIVVTDRATKTAKRFEVHPSDRHAITEEDCVPWRSPRYLEVSAGRLAFLDTETMKLSYPFAVGKEPKRLEFDPSFGWAVSTVDERLEVAPVTLP